MTFNIHTSKEISKIQQDFIERMTFDQYMNFCTFLCKKLEKMVETKQ